MRRKASVCHAAVPFLLYDLRLIPYMYARLAVNLLRPELITDMISEKLNWRRFYAAR